MSTNGDAGGTAGHRLRAPTPEMIERSALGMRPDRGPNEQLRSGWLDSDWDVVVIGGGNAGIASALSATDLGARVLVLESAPREMRGGNTRHTRNIRCVHDHADEFNSGAYHYHEMWSDLCSVGDGPANDELAAFTVRDSATIPSWMEAHGARWQRPLSGTLHLGRTNRFFLGGGKALLNSYYRELRKRSGISVVYDTKFEDFQVAGRGCNAVTVVNKDREIQVSARAVVCASGGFEANLQWLRRYWGDAVDNYIIRGTPYNDGHVLSRLYEMHAAKAGKERGFHAIALDARAPKFDGGIATRLDTVPFGIVVNRHGKRFYDEGEDLWPKRYAAWGELIARQPGQLAFSLWDSKVRGLFLPPMFGVTEAESITDVASGLGLDPAAVAETVTQYNHAVSEGRFDPRVLDGCGTRGLMPAKSNWAQRLDRPPYYGVAMRPGITFTYMGVAVQSDGRVVREDGSAFSNIFAAGEIMSGNILTNGYLAGFGMTIGSVWGRLAGARAARLALSKRMGHNAEAADRAAAR